MTVELEPGVMCEMCKQYISKEAKQCPHCRHIKKETKICCFKCGQVFSTSEDECPHCVCKREKMLDIKRPDVEIIKEGSFEPKKKEMVNNPEHYQGVCRCPNCGYSIEAIEIMRDKTCDVANALKYQLRAGKKDGNSYLQELRKARWYLDDEIKNLEKT